MRTRTTHWDEYQTRDEYGAAMVFVAIAVFGLFLVIGAAIDSMNLLAAARQTQFTTNMVSLGALEEYFRNSSLSLEQRVQAAENRAQQILQTNPVFNQAASTINTANGSLKLESGQWIQPKTNGVPSGTPYFEKYTGAAGQAINAFKFYGNYSGATRLFLIDKLLPNVAAAPLTGEAVATVAPRRACFLVDLSSTVVTETYKDRSVADQQTDPSKGRGAAYTFLLGSDNPTVTGRNWHDESYWNVVNSAETRGAAAGSDQLNPLIHFKDDYKFKGLFNDTDYTRNAGYLPTLRKLHPDPATDSRFAVGNARVYSRADGFRDGVHQGPQPLRNIITGIRTVVSEFKARQVYGDKVCLIFFDETTDWRRTVLPTDNFDYVLKLLSVGSVGDTVTADDARAAIDAAGLDPAAYQGQELAVRLGIFPQPAANTNAILPLALAQELLANDTESAGGIGTTDFVVIATDGLSNCKPAAVGYSCNDTFEYYRDSMARIRDTIVPAYVNSSIPIHVILSGSISGPHTLDMQKSDTDTDCASDSDARVAGRKFVSALDPEQDYAGWYYDYHRASDYQNKSADNPYYFAVEDWYDVAVRTRGMFIPIRPAPSNPSDCVPPGSERTCPAGVTRRLTDPFCRTAEQQTIDAAKRLLGQNPYVVVKTMSDNYVTP